MHLFSTSNIYIAQIFWDKLPIKYFRVYGFVFGLTSTTKSILISSLTFNDSIIITKLKPFLYRYLHRNKQLTRLDERMFSGTSSGPMLLWVPFVSPESTWDSVSVVLSELFYSGFAALVHEWFCCVLVMKRCVSVYKL